MNLRQLQFLQFPTQTIPILATLTLLAYAAITRGGSYPSTLRPEPEWWTGSDWLLPLLIASLIANVWQYYDRIKDRSNEKEEYGCVQCNCEMYEPAPLLTNGKMDLVPMSDCAEEAKEKYGKQLYKLESVYGTELAVEIRREILCVPETLPYKDYSYQLIYNRCCENVVGYIPVPVGVAGPLHVDDAMMNVPMATTEGCLVASTSRGCKILNAAGGVQTEVVADAMTRAPVLECTGVRQSKKVYDWIANNNETIKTAFEATSRFAKLKNVNVWIVGKLVYIRFEAETGDAMGMNMVSKATEAALHVIIGNFDDIKVLALSGNVCTDKKSAAVNWVLGRGKSVVAEAVIPNKLLKEMLGVSAQQMAKVNTAKNLVGSAVAGSLGGFNAQAANIVTAIFIATGQDVAQNVSSSSCLTVMEDQGDSLYVSCTMPSVEVGIIGGGTGLHAQATCIKMAGISSAKEMARLVAAAVLAGELSLLAALVKKELVSSHLRLNRKK